jgi:hypothetical protein
MRSIETDDMLMILREDGTEIYARVLQAETTRHFPASMSPHALQTDCHLAILKITNPYGEVWDASKQ